MTPRRDVEAGRFDAAGIDIAPPVMLGPQTYGGVADRVAGIPRGVFGRRFLAGVGLAMAVTMVLATAVLHVILRGVGIWGIQIPVGWGFAIINFVWWIGIGHAGTLISAILLLARQEWRTSINRFAEAMTLFAVVNAAVFPLLHLGRIWKFYYLFPYPDNLNLYPQWRSPLVWDVIAVSTYGLVSLIFWYVGLLPDLATMRDRIQRRGLRRLVGFFALGWRGAARHWSNYRALYLLLGGIATPLVVSVHSIVSFDFSVSQVPGWHSTIFPPYFVAGAIYSGFAMVFTLVIPLRAVFRLHDLVTERHLDAMAKVLLASGLVVGYGYLMEFFTAWYSTDAFERYIMQIRVVGHYWPAFALMMLGNVVVPQFCWSRRVRRSPAILFLLAILVNVGMWCERFVIVVTSLYRDFLPSSWQAFVPTIWDWATYAGTLGFFALLVLLFIRSLPMISIAEVNEQVHHHRVEGWDTTTPPHPDEVDDAEPLPDRIPDDLLHGLIAEFADPESLTTAARRLREAGYTRLEAYTPFPVEPLDEALALPPSRVPRWVLGGAIGGAALMYGYAWFTTSVDYVWNVGGKPPHSWPSFVPITFELGVLGACVTGLVAMLALNGLPRLHHPVFGAPGFRRASRDRFFLCVERRDPRFERERTRAELAGLAPLRVSEVPA